MIVKITRNEEQRFNIKIHRSSISDECTIITFNLEQGTPTQSYRKSSDDKGGRQPIRKRHLITPLTHPPVRNRAFIEDTDIP